jgi:peptidoglycan lytic transglycosylase G
MRGNSLASHSRLRRFFASVFVLAVLGGLSAAGVWYLGPVRASQEETFVEIEHGMSSRAIADLLAGDGLVRSNWAFLAVRFLHPHAKLQAGEYRFGAEQTPFEIFDKISRGQVYFVVVTIPEGSNRFDIAAILEQASTIKPDDFLAASAEAESIRDLDPKAPSLEGYLFPSSYEVTHATTAKQLCHMMTNEFRRQWRALVPVELPGGETHRVVTLASLVEKETGVAAERLLVAGVFTNRLRVNMPLQCDPTTVYAALLDSRYNGVIHKSDLASTNPYNTYAHSGLPPGPIANPGAPSLKAALHPSSESYLYFVARADGSGGHHFSATLAEHEKAVADFRKASR